MVGLTDRMATFVACDAADLDISNAGLEEPAVLGLLDWVGVAIAGSQQPVSERMRSVLNRLGGSAQATVLPGGSRTSVSNAALLNGVAGHALDYDDTHLLSAVHASAVVLPAALALAEWRGSTGRQLLASYAIGCEVATYLGELVRPWHWDAPWHTTAVAGAIGAAAAACHLLGASQSETGAAMGLAASTTLGLRATFGTHGKPYQVARAAEAGVVAALLAVDGIECSPTVMEDRLGFIPLLAGHHDVASAVDPPPLGSWRLARLDRKLHASCHATHAAIDAALEIRAEPGFSVDQVGQVEITCSPATLSIAGNPSPGTGLEAKFSVAYAVGIALTFGTAGPDRFTDAATGDRRIRALVGATNVQADDRLAVTEAEVRVQLDNGVLRRAYAAAPHGSALNPATAAELRSKFDQLVGPVIGLDLGANLAAAIRRAGDQPDVIALWGPLGAAR